MSNIGKLTLMAGGGNDHLLAEMGNITEIQDIKIKGVVSIIFKALYSAIISSMTIAATIFYVRTRQLSVAVTITAIGLLILFKIVNHSLGTRILYQDGRIEEGIFQNGLLVKGIRSCPDGQREEGVFQDQWLIEGEVIRMDGMSAQGKFEKGLLVDGRKNFFGGFMEGSFKDGWLVEGKAVYTDVLTSIGTFDKGKFIKGEQTLANGLKEIGIFKNGWLVEGKTIYPNGDVLEGIFDAGILKCDSKI